MTTDELRAKFEAKFSQPPYEWSFRRHSAYGAWPDCYKDYNVQCAWNGYVNGHASRDAEVEALRKDAERYRAFRRAAIREDDSFIERVMLRIPDKDCTESQFDEAIDAAMWPE